jgi:signal transduction histidine kinase
VRLKSLYTGTLVAMVGILALSFVAFQAISLRMQILTIDPIFDRADEVELQAARGELSRGGPAALQTYMAGLNHLFGGFHYLLDVHGVDLVTGANMAAVLPAPPANKSRFMSHGHNLITHRSQDGQFWFVANSPVSRPRLITFLPYYFLVIGATVVLCWLAAAGVVSPIRKIASTIATFGQGDLSVRVATRRPDEIGQLGNSFNQMAERLQRLIVSERRLLGDISHELRSPLARLKFAIKLARTSSDPKAALDRIERDVNRIASLVSDIVEIAFVEGDPALRGAQPVRISDIVNEVVRDCTVEAQFRQCTIEKSGTIEGEVLGSPELLRRAFENVLRNAIRYAPEQSVVAVLIAENGNDAMMVVRDFGPGVPQEMLKRIFDPFFRVDEARDAAGGGSGLGLSIAKRAVQVHHGAILAENAFPGLRVQITIPLVARPLLVK